MFKTITDRISAYYPQMDMSRVSDAYTYAEMLYARYGDDFSYIHELLDILLTLKADEDTIVGMILHDLFFKDRIDAATVRTRFGVPVMQLLISVRKILHLHYNEREMHTQADVFRKLFLVMARDVRVIVILLVRRLFVLSHLGDGFSVEQGITLAKDTLDIYVPIASRLGIYRLKTQLEDYSFKYLQPDEYARVYSEMTRFHREYGFSLQDLRSSIADFLKENGIDAKVVGRLKSVYSVYKKMEVKRYDQVEELYDLFAIRVILPAVYDPKGAEVVDALYAVLALLHSRWRPISRRFKDYVAVPKPNGYRSLHTVLQGLVPANQEQPVEIQIRTGDMHASAEYGIAAHWLYKHTGEARMPLNSYSEWIRGLEHFYEDLINSNEVIRQIHIDIFNDRIFVLTPQGDVKDLPRGATPVDFAYAIHSEVGNRCVMAKVDGHIVPLNYMLKNGEVVEVVTQIGAVPKLQWFSFVKTHLARRKIKAWFNQLHQSVNAAKPTEKRSYNAERTIQSLERPPLAMDKVVVGGEEHLPVRLAKCCAPEGGMIVGYVTRGNHVTIHAISCVILKTLDYNRILFARWKKDVEADEGRKEGIVVTFQVEVVSAQQAFRDIALFLFQEEVVVQDLQIHKNSQGITGHYFLIQVLLFSEAQYGFLRERLAQMEGVVRVTS